MSLEERLAGLEKRVEEMALLLEALLTESEASRPSLETQHAAFVARIRESAGAS
jgi:hypothetical protein